MDLTGVCLHGKRSRTPLLSSDAHQLQASICVNRHELPDRHNVAAKNLQCCRLAIKGQWNDGGGGGMSSRSVKTIPFMLMLLITCMCLQYKCRDSFLLLSTLLSVGCNTTPPLSIRFCFRMGCTCRRMCAVYTLYAFVIWIINSWELLSHPVFLIHSCLHRTLSVISSLDYVVQWRIMAIWRMSHAVFTQLGLSFS